MTPRQQLEAILDRAQEMMADTYECFNNFLIPKLQQVGITFLKSENLSERQKDFLDDYWYWSEVRRLKKG